MKESKHSLATLLGHGYAHVQHLMDKGIEWGLGKMKESDLQEAPTKDEEHGRLKRTRRVIRGLFGLVGTAGTAYYEKYEELKTKSKRKGE